MVAFGPSISCQDAEPYYYDYLCGLDADIPQAVVDHIRRCADCRTQVRQLEAAIAESEAQDHRAQGDGNVLGALSLHFAHIGEEITCATAKSFLPLLLVPSLKIRIPTPVTVHVDHCHPCAENLEALRELELRPEQLARLSRLYAAISDGNSHMCRRVRAKTWAFACASFEGMDAEVLDHMCVCPRCRRRVYRRRETILAGRQPGDTIPGVGLCSGISMADLFEWVVPYSRTGDGPEQATAAEEAMPSHLRACPECIERMQVLHHTIYGMAERANSGVATVYTTGAGVETSAGRAESLYCGYPIHVEVAQHDPKPAVTRFGPIAGILAALRRAAANPQFRPAMRAAVIATAMVPLAILLLISIRPASGISVQQLSDTIKGTEALHFKQYADDGTRLAQEFWIVRGPDVVMVSDSRGDTLYDFTGLEKLIRPPGSGTTERAVLTKDEPANLEEYVDSILGQVLAGVPMDGGLRRLGADTVGGGRQDTVVYELAWDTTSSTGFILHHRLKAFLHRTTRLPQWIERSRLTPDDEQWRVTSVREFEYPSREEAERTIRGAFPVGQNQSGDQRGL